MIIDCISDLHGHFPELQGGDLLIVAGDLTARHTSQEWDEFQDWLTNQPYTKKILIAGNHDTFIIDRAEDMTWNFWEHWSNVTYLCDSGTEFVYYPPLEKGLPNGMALERKKLTIWGSPWTKKFPGMNPKAMAFTVDTEEELANKWSLIPDDVDILVTHSAPNGILDQLKEENKYAGSESLRNATLNSTRFKRKKLHVFGHIHENGGKMIDLACCKFVNASIVNEHYKLVNKPVRVEL